MKILIVGSDNYHHRLGIMAEVRLQLIEQAKNLGIIVVGSIEKAEEIISPQKLAIEDLLISLKNIEPISLFRRVRASYPFIRKDKRLIAAKHLMRSRPSPQILRILKIRQKKNRQSHCEGLVTTRLFLFILFHISTPRFRGESELFA